LDDSSEKAAGRKVTIFLAVNVRSPKETTRFSSETFPSDRRNAGGEFFYGQGKHIFRRISRYPRLYCFRAAIGICARHSAGTQAKKAEDSLIEKRRPLPMSESMPNAGWAKWPASALRRFGKEKRMIQEEQNFLERPI
jgi:hypothetical protein